MNKNDIAIIGYGEHSKVIRASISPNLFTFIGYICPFNDYNGTEHIGEDNDLKKIIQTNNKVKFILGIGNLKLRKKLLKKYYTNIGFTNIIHKHTIISKEIEIGQGVFIAQGATVQCEVKIKDHCIINTGSIIEHDCIIGTNSHIAPGCVLGGGSKIGKNSFVGLGSVIKDHITIGDNVTIGAGSVVINNIENNKTVLGVPAREIKQC